MQSNIQQFLGVPAIWQYEKYLGFPALVGRAKKQSFIYLKERVWRKLQGWKEKILSHVGKKVLIKSVIQAIPTYTISCFKLPKGLVKELEVLIRKFWWGILVIAGRSIGLSRSGNVRPRKLGDWGSKKQRSSMIPFWPSKQVWRMINNPNSLCHRMFKARFFPNCSILEAKDSIVGSYA